MNRLLTTEAMTLLAEVGPIDSKTDIIGLITKLRKAGHDPILVTEVVTQARLRTRAKAKFGDFANQMLFTEAGLEQATRLEVAALHAERFRSVGHKVIADLGCGIAADSLAFAALGLDVTAVEQDAETAALAAFNLAPFPNAKVQIASAEAVDLTRFDALWLDPARRDLERKTARHITLQPEDFSPNLNWAFEIEKPKGIKLGPAFPHELIPAVAQPQWVSHNSDLVELTLWFDDLKTSDNAVATMLKQGARYEFEGDREQSVAVRELGEFVFEPDSGLIRSHLLGDFANRNRLGLVSDSIAYLTSDKDPESPWLKAYELLEVLPLDEGVLRRHFAQNDIGSVEIKKRGVDITPEQLRPKLKLKGSGAATMILTKVGGARKALLVRPIR
ncbi:MAG: hypothetical protein RL418_702 [Actinomycetota bacterium]|jgi:hypothetical protein